MTNGYDKLETNKDIHLAVLGCIIPGSPKTIVWIEWFSGVHSYYSLDDPDFLKQPRFDRSLTRWSVPWHLKTCSMDDVGGLSKKTPPLQSQLAYFRVLDVGTFKSMVVPCDSAFVFSSLKLSRQYLSVCWWSHTSQNWSSYFNLKIVLNVSGWKNTMKLKPPAGVSERPVGYLYVSVFPFSFFHNDAL